ncbi:MAG TPA: hypothetical protein VGW35_24290 [Methylomirabilota bacterium]|nr:hypothetical protein [Methylomirabilota bacterium]
MTQRSDGPRLGSETLARIQEGMTVYDRDNVRIGTVRRVYLGASSEAEIGRGVGAVSPPDPDRFDRTFLDDLAGGLFASDSMPEELRERLAQHGFMQIDSAGLFAADRYVLPEQIASVSGDEVRLSVRRNGLMKAA